MTTTAANDTGLIVYEPCSPAQSALQPGARRRRGHAVSFIRQVPDCGRPGYHRGTRTG